MASPKGTHTGPGGPSEASLAAPTDDDSPDDLPNRLAILLVEDSRTDAELLGAHLGEAGFVVQVTRVENRANFQAALSVLEPHVIVSDYSLPNYSGREALSDARSIRPETPFIFYSGTIGEERAIETLRDGALDYVLKDRPKRLVSAVRRALKEADDKRAHRTAQSRIAAQARLIDLASDAIVVISLKGRILFWNQGAERLYGCRMSEVVGDDCASLLYDSPAADFLEARRQTLEQGAWQGELEQSCKGKKCIVWSRWTLVADGVQGETEILTISSDITEKKELEANFLRAQRLESIGAIAGGITHDLNNILGPIRMATDLLRSENLTGEAAALLELIDESARRGAGIVNQVLTFARGSDGKRGELDLRTVIPEATQVTTATFPRNIKVRVAIESDLWPIKADATQIHQVLMNLCVNARDAMPTGGQLTISARNIPGPQGGSAVLVEVADTGTGIQPELIEKIFDPFFTTKEPGKGTGLGLSTVAGIVKSHNGRIDVKSAPGEGTSFLLFFPALLPQESSHSKS